MKRLVDGCALTDDPVEIHLIQQYSRLNSQNKRLISQIRKTGAWTQSKAIDSWKPFDFYNLFCVLYENKFGVGYGGKGSTVRAWKRIEAFIKENDITNADYKLFIEGAFVRKFTSANKPTIGSIISPSLYKFINGKHARAVTATDLHTLDKQLEREDVDRQALYKEKGVRASMTVGELSRRLQS